jgi:hypothetical protein
MIESLAGQTLDSFGSLCARRIPIEAGNESDIMAGFNVSSPVDARERADGLIPGKIRHPSGRGGVSCSGRRNNHAIRAATSASASLAVRSAAGLLLLQILTMLGVRKAARPGPILIP